MSKKLTILFTPMEGHGHVNPCIGIGQILLKRGHRVVFAIDKSWNGRLKKLGFGEELIVLPEDTSKSDGDLSNTLLMSGVLSPASPLEKLKFMGKMMEHSYKKFLAPEPFVKEIVDRVKPDVIIVDQISALPSMIKSCPWVYLFSPNPLVPLDDIRAPPPMSGLPSNDSSEWDLYRDEYKKSMTPMHESINKLYIENDLSPLTENKIVRDSPFLNFYLYPEELDYTDLRPVPSKWYRFDAFIRTEEENFDLPETLKDKPGKLIYLSMGSLGSADLNLLKRLVNILSESPHRFIVSKGPHFDKYELPSNMWGDKMVPQIQVLEMVDLAIIHGGNNSLTETFYFGKPMIVMPLFADQFDNAQRIEEKGYGLRLDPYRCTSDELLNAIESILNDQQLAIKMKNASERIHRDFKSERIAELIESVVN